jgi:hypothetical protein
MSGIYHDPQYGGRRSSTTSSLSNQPNDDHHVARPQRPTDQYLWTETDLQQLRQERDQAQAVRDLYHTINGVDMSGRYLDQGEEYDLPPAELDHVDSIEFGIRRMSVNEIYGFHEQGAYAVHPPFHTRPRGSDAESNSGESFHNPYEACYLEEHLPSETDSDASSDSDADFREHEPLDEPDQEQRDVEEYANIIVERYLNLLDQDPDSEAEVNEEVQTLVHEAERVGWDRTDSNDRETWARERLMHMIGMQVSIIWDNALSAKMEAQLSRDDFNNTQQADEATVEMIEDFEFVDGPPLSPCVAPGHQDHRTLVERNLGIEQLRYHVPRLENQLEGYLDGWCRIDPQAFRQFNEHCQNARLVTACQVRFWDIMSWFPYYTPCTRDTVRNMVALQHTLNDQTCRYDNLAAHRPAGHRGEPETNDFDWAFVMDHRARRPGGPQFLPIPGWSCEFVLFGFEMCDEAGYIYRNGLADFDVPHSTLSVAAQMNFVKAHLDIRMVRFEFALSRMEHGEDGAQERRGIVDSILDRLLQRGPRPAHASHKHVANCIRVWFQHAVRYLHTILAPENHPDAPVLRSEGDKTLVVQTWIHLLKCLREVESKAIMDSAKREEVVEQFDQSILDVMNARDGVFEWREFCVDYKCMGA